MSKDDRNRNSRIVIVRSVRPSKPVKDQPEVWLARWRIYEMALPDPEGVTQHLVGWSTLTRYWRISSPIQYIDPVTRRCVTRSGRTYHLYGGPGSSEDAWYVWCAATWLPGIDGARDVTDELSALFETAYRQH